MMALAHCVRASYFQGSDMEKKVLAKVEDTFYGVEDHGIFTCYLRLSMGGLHQSFGGLFLDKVTKGPDFYRGVCSLFGVRELIDIRGKNVFALYCFGKNNENIEGLENQYGQRFTLTKFSRKYDANIKSPLERKEESLKREIIQLQERIKLTRVEIKKIKKDYTDWEKK